MREVKEVVKKLREACVAGAWDHKGESTGLGLAPHCSLDLSLKQKQGEHVFCKGWYLSFKKVTLVTV